MTVSHKTEDHAPANSNHKSVVRSQTMAGLERIRSEFAFTVKGSYDKVAPLFGAEAERVWAGNYWNPRFLYPNPAKDEKGAIFATSMNNLPATWVNTAFDIANGYVQYVYIVPDTLVTMIDIHITRQGNHYTAVHVVYLRTALKPSANDEVKHRAEADILAGQEWRDGINEALASGRVK